MHAHSTTLRSGAFRGLGGEGARERDRGKGGAGARGDEGGAALDACRSDGGPGVEYHHGVVGDLWGVAQAV